MKNITQSIKIISMLLSAMTITITVFAQQDGSKNNKNIKSKNKLPPFSIYQGSAGEWVSNDDYIYNGFYLQTNTTKYIVRIPQDKGTELSYSIHQGVVISVEGIETKNGNQVPEIRPKTMKLNGKIIYDQLKSEVLIEKEDELISGSGTVVTIQRSKQDEIIGYVLNNKTILRFLPHVVDNLARSIMVGTMLFYSGGKRAIHPGEVQSDNYTIVHCRLITLDGQEYSTH